MAGALEGGASASGGGEGGVAGLLFMAGRGGQVRWGR